jgi:membrane protease YdiL (CAAX protease family)
MIPDDDPLPRPPLTIEYAFLIALIAPLVHLAWEILFEILRVPLGQARVGMAALLTYGGAFALCAVRFRQPPARQLGFVRAPSSAWLAMLFLVPAVVLSSELDNVLRALLPPVPSTPPPHPGEISRFAGPAVAVLELGVFPLAYGVFFRGVLQPLATARLGVIPGVLLTAVMAAFAEIFLPALDARGLLAMSPVLLNALVLCILRQCASSLYPALALEVLWGASMVGAAYRVFDLAGFDGAGPHTPMPWVVGAAVLTGVGLALCRFTARATSDRSSSPAQG